MLLLAVGGCGHEAYEDSYPTTSGVIVDAGAATPDTATQDTGAPPSTGAIMFVASPGGGRPPRLIARTDSITTAPTAEFLAREALATRRGAPNADADTRVAAPLMITADDDMATPITLPVVPTTIAGSGSSRVASPRAASPRATSPRATSPHTNSRITISRQTGVDGGPTILKIIEAP